MTLARTTFFTLSVSGATLAVACGGSAPPPAAPAAPASSPASAQVDSALAPPGGIGLGNVGGNPTADRRLDPSKVRGRLPPEVIQKIVRDNFGPMRKCYEAGLARDPTLKGKISTRFVIELDGHVSSALDNDDAGEDPSLAALRGTAHDPRRSQEEPRFPDPKVVACVVARFNLMTFPKPEGGKVTVVYPIIFTPSD